MKQQLQERLLSALQELGITVSEISLSYPPDSSMGDYATNVAMLASKQAGMNPRELAEKLAEVLRTEPLIEKVEIAGPGFINIFLKQEYFLNILQENQLEGLKKHLKTSFSGKKVMVEFTDPNPFKEFHIGHLYSNTVGESIARLVEAAGAEVKRANYQGDVGLHVAKAVWGMKRKIADEGIELTELETKSIEERAKWLGESYALGAAAFEEDPVAKDEIIQVNKQVYEEDPEVYEVYMTGRQWSLDYFELIYARLGTTFAYYYFESKAGPIGLELVREYEAKGIFVESQGAVIFPGEQHGLHTRVFINSLGLPTYEAKELGLAVTKEQDFPFDTSITITGNEINEYFKVLIKALSLIKPELAAKIRHISHGMVRLPEGKMSSRTGNVLTGEWLLNEAKAMLKEAYTEMHEETLEQVAVGAVKWALLRSGVGKDISFSLKESISFEGDSGPYIQYTFARTQSVLGKLQIANGKSMESDHKLLAISYKLALEELALLKLLSRYPEIVAVAAEHYSPNTLTNYLFDVAQTFNLFYQKQRILDAPDEQRILRLALTKATGNILENGLQLLGIQSPEKM